MRQVGQTGDFFLEQRSSLYRSLNERCLALAGQRALAGFGEIEKSFNLRLAGKFPFSAAGSGVYAVEAEPDEVRGFFRLFDAHDEYLDFMPADVPRRPEILQFVAATRAVRAFFAHYLDNPESGLAPVYDIDVEFRINQQAGEVAGNLIIGWELEVGGKTVSFRDAERRARWTVGRPITLYLRWAKDSPWEPVTDGTEPKLAGDGRTLIYEFDNRWSLISFVADNRSAGQFLGTFADTRPHTLVFEVETRPRTDRVALGSAPPPPGPTRIFLRVTVLAPDGDEPKTLELPRFPDRAPKPESGDPTAFGRRPESRRR